MIKPSDVEMGFTKEEVRLLIVLLDTADMNIPTYQRLWKKFTSALRYINTGEEIERERQRTS